MLLSDILQERHSVRGFKATPIDSTLLEDVFCKAQQSPSNCNVQPWQTYVVSGEKKDELSKLLISEVMKQQSPEPDFDWNIAYKGIHRERQFGAANALYSAMAVSYTHLTLPTTPYV